jgi:hypothetical protein
MDGYKGWNSANTIIGKKTEDLTFSDKLAAASLGVVEDLTFRIS